jgi:hypothetical protein
MARPIQLKRKKSGKTPTDTSAKRPSRQFSGETGSKDTRSFTKSGGASSGSNVIRRAPEIVASPQVRVPGAWGWFFDEAVTTWVKDKYSPRESWKGKPFTKDDSRFFFRGIDELSEMFTEERSKGIPAYFNHPKFRSAYMLYFFPLQAAKFVTIFQLHAKAFEAALEHGRREGELRIADLGAGPGTASIAALLQLLQIATATGDDLPPIKLLWIDTNTSIMQDGKKLAEELVSHFSKLRGKVEIEIRTGPWWKAASVINKPTSLMLLGHVLNESSGPEKPRKKRLQNIDDEVDTEMGVARGRNFRSESSTEFGDEFLDESDASNDESDGESDAESQDESHEESQSETRDGDSGLEYDGGGLELPDENNATWGTQWRKLFSRAAGGGTLFVEPASKRNSQFLSQLRDEFLENEVVAKDPSSIWGPCLHAERCPLAGGRDWCHFSVPAKVPGSWFLEFSKALGSERQWLKFSYLWIASQLEGQKRAPVQASDLRRVVSDVLSPRDRERESEKTPSVILLCEPEVPARLTVPRINDLKRGDLVKLT